MTSTALLPHQITETSPLLCILNKGYMTQWINRDLVNRANNDVRTSTVLYDAEFSFVAALPAAVELRPDILEALHEVGVRYYSKGIV